MNKGNEQFECMQRKTGQGEPKGKMTLTFLSLFAR
jgi:hypothetical protein